MGCKLTLTINLDKPEGDQSYGETFSDMLAVVARRVRTKPGGTITGADGVKVGTWKVR